jgi:hypothetical protein
LNFAKEDAVLQLVDAWERKALGLRRKLALVIPNGVCGVRNLSGVFAAAADGRGRAGLQPCRKPADPQGF